MPLCGKVESVARALLEDDLGLAASMQLKAEEDKARCHIAFMDFRVCLLMSSAEMQLQ